MSVLKRNRRESQFEVFHHLYKLRREMTDLLLRDFGCRFEKAEKRLQRMFGGKGYEDLTDSEKQRYDKSKKRYESFDEWFIIDQRKVIIDCFWNIQENVFVANSIYPMYWEELIERRVHQDRAIGQCYELTQELQYAIESLPIDVNTYTRFGESMPKEINLIKGWRKSDNKFKGGKQCTQSNCPMERN